MIYIIYSVSVRIFTTISRKSEKRGKVRMVLLKRRNIFELCAMKQWKHWQAIVAERRLIIIPFNKTVINDNFIKCKYIFRYRFQYFNRVLPPSVPKKGRRRCRQRPNSKSMFNRKHYGWSESHQTLSVLT